MKPKKWSKINRARETNNGGNGRITKKTHDRKKKKNTEYK